MCGWFNLSQVGSSVNLSLKRRPLKWQCPVNSPITHLNWSLFSFNRSFVCGVERNIHAFLLVLSTGRAARSQSLSLLRYPRLFEDIWYCHVSWVPWLIIKGFGLDDLIYWHFYYNHIKQLTINDCQRLAPFLTGQRVCSLDPWLTWFWFTSRSLLLPAG
jgi:hypothetical protein